MLGGPAASDAVDVGRGRTERLVRLSDARLPGHEQPQEDGHERQMERVSLGVRCQPPCDRGERQADTRQHAEDGRARQHTNEVHRDTGCHGHTQGGQDVHPERRLAEGLEDHGREPPEKHVGREAGRVSGAHEWPDSLELARVPELETGLERGERRREGDGSDRDRRRQVDRPHLPTIRATALRREAQRDPRCDVRNRWPVGIEPWLKTHEVDDDDGCGRQGSLR